MTLYRSSRFHREELILNHEIRIFVERYPTLIKENHHMSALRKALVFIGMLIALTVVGNAQQSDLSGQLSKIIGANANNYLEPLASGLGAGLNSGFYHSADLHSVLGFDIGVKMSLAMISDAHKTFDFVLPDQITIGPLTYRAGIDYAKNVPNSPTFAGGSGIPVKSTGLNNGTVIFTTPSGFNYTRLPMFAPQAAIGLPFGIEVIGRFLPSTNLGDAGKVNFVGFGLRYDIDQYIPFCPVDIAVHFMTQKVTIDDKSGNKVMSLSGTAFGAEVSKSLILFTLYTGVQFENSNLSVESYQYTDPSTGVTAQVNGFSLTGVDKTRFLVGFRVLLAVINLHADYSFSKYPVLTAGVGITFR